MMLQVEYDPISQFASIFGNPIKSYNELLLIHSAEAAEYTDCISAERWNSPPTSVLDMTLNNLIVSFQ